MTVDLSKAQVLATIPLTDFSQWPEEEKTAAREWAHANGVGPNCVSINRDIEIVLLDCPAIAWSRLVLDERGNAQLHPKNPDEVWTERTLTALRVPLPVPPSFPVTGESR